MGKAKQIDPDLFGSALQPVTGWQRTAIIHRLRHNGHEVTLRGRGVCTVYITPNAEGTVIARCTKTANGRKRWRFTRFGKFTREQVAFIHSLRP